MLLFEAFDALDSSRDHHLEWILLRQTGMLIVLVVCLRFGGETSKKHVFCV